MISDSERREVAEDLRDMNPADFDFPYGAPVFEHIFKCVFPRQMYLTNWILRVPFRLADLIDRPTCRNVGASDYFCCSKCRFEHPIAAKSSTDGCGKPVVRTLHFSYCPNCGAEVLDD